MGSFHTAPMRLPTNHLNLMGVVWETSHAANYPPFLGFECRNTLHLEAHVTILITAAYRRLVRETHRLS